jgi:hypothetical protein
VLNRASSRIVGLEDRRVSHSEVIRAMVIAQLHSMRKEYDLKLATPEELAAIELGTA